MYLSLHSSLKEEVFCKKRPRNISSHILQVVMHGAFEIQGGPILYSQGKRFFFSLTSRDKELDLSNLSPVIVAIPPEVLDAPSLKRVPCSLLKEPYNSHLGAWSLSLCSALDLIFWSSQSTHFVSFCVFVLVLRESSDKYHPNTSVRVLVFVVSFTTHTSLCDLYMLSFTCQKSLPTTLVFI